MQREAELEVQQLEETKDPWILFTDGASNVKGTGLGILLKSPQGDIIPHSIACEFQTTNNEAEYEALIAGLQIAKHIRIRYLEVHVDSLLITNHFNGSYTVKGEKLIKYLEIVKDLALSFVSFSLTHVPREENAEADALANLGSSLKIPEDIKIPIIHILNPAIEDHAAMEIGEDSAIIPSDDTQSHSGSWILPIMKYIQHGEIPTGENPSAFKIKVSQFTILNNMLYK
ncbi:putative ribonuclease H [Helianthus annuus]|nr:putative ribonuclease H [Helianthus annuus]KAJ0494450.1 putative ribonuclease H [Helianthus annuus]KAJ0506209.1 putative ribonuclease H [Helianthus annuus]KAJ0675880.1 putative ribonuclease H [Helianthus annuus]KAJ0867586.1 putative ribonuclease H [Helianthus annuus]